MKLKFHVFNAWVAQKLPTVFLDHIADLNKMVKQKFNSEQHFPFQPAQTKRAESRSFLFLIFRHRVRDDIAERLSGLSLYIRQSCFRSR